MCISVAVADDRRDFGVHLRSDESLDTYTAFLTGDQLDDVYSQIEGNFVGLGIELKAEEGSLLIADVIPQWTGRTGGNPSR